MHRQRHSVLTYYDFESDFDYQQQLHETMKSRTAVVHNRAATEEYFKTKWDDAEVIEWSERLRTSREELTLSVKQFMNLFKRQPDMDAHAQPEQHLGAGVLQLQAPPAAAFTHHVQVLQAPQVVQVTHHTAQQISAVALVNANYLHISQQASQIFHISQIPVPVPYYPIQVYQHFMDLKMIQIPVQIPEACEMHPPSQVEIQELPDYPDRPERPEFQELPAFRECPEFQGLPDIPTHTQHSLPTMEDSPLRAMFFRNLKQRILNEIQERTAHCNLKQQVAIQDSLSCVLDRDPLQVLEHVGYHAILRHDEFNIPKTAKHVDEDGEETALRNERKLNEMAEEFCLSDFSLEVMRACDQNTKGINKSVHNACKVSARLDE